jgi:hypothetical protein
MTINRGVEIFWFQTSPCLSFKCGKAKIISITLKHHLVGDFLIMSTRRYKRTNLVQRLEDDSFGSSTRFGLGQLLLTWLFASLLASLAYAVPMTTNYQGYLENTQAEPLNATVNMTFALYATAQGGNALWTETHQQIEVTDGVFSVTLGSQNPFTDDNLAGERYLGVTVGSDPEMTPRQPLTSAFFAMRAGVADSVKAAAVTGEAIAEGAVTAEKIAAQTITGDKIANLSGHSVTELDDVTDAGSGKIITDVEREKLESLTPGSTASSPTFENLNVKNELKVGEHTLYLAGDAQGGQIWATGGQKRLALQTNGGKVGIGTITPQVKLHVVEPGNVSIGVENTNFESNFSALYAKTAKNNILTAIFSEGDTAQGGIGTTSNHPFYIRTNNIQRMTFDVTGNVGIGTTTPQVKLHVTEPGDVNVGVENTNINSNFAQYYAKSAKGGIATVLFSEGYSGQGGVGTNSNHPFYIRTNTIQRMTVDVVGNVGIGTTIPQYKLDVAGTIRGNNVSPSDQRLKQNIQPLENSLAKVEQLRGVSFEWKDKKQEAGTQVGMIAQEVETVIPELVSTDSEGYKSLAYDKITAHLVQAIKELKAQNDALKAQNDAIKAIVCEDHPEKAICQ